MRNYFVVEGLIGVGKTSLCRLLEREWGARLVLEPCDDNPFLAAFYDDRERYAFPAQMFYLASRYAQQVELAQLGLFDRVVVADYHFLKDRLFAEYTLEGDELALYERFTRLLSPRVPTPEFVVFLDAPTEVVLERIRRRNIPAERAITAEYLDGLRERYMRLWARYDEAPVYVVDTADMDYVADPADRARILGLLRGWLDGRPAPGAPPPLRAAGGEALPLFDRGWEPSGEPGPGTRRQNCPDGS